MNRFIRYTTSDRILLLGLGGSLFFIVLSLLFCGIFYASLPPFLPLFNQMSWGVARLGTKIEIFVPIVIAALVLIVNTILGTIMYEKIPLLSRILSITSVLITIFVFLFTIRTIQIII